MPHASSRLPGLHRASMQERLRRVAEAAQLSYAQVSHLSDTGSLDAATADRMIENTIGTMNVPRGVATNLIIDGRETLVPMATEESSVVAAVSNASRQCRDSGGIHTATSGSL